MKKTTVALALIAFAFSAFCDGLSIENDLATLAVDGKGRVVSLREKGSGRELAKGKSAFVCLRDATDRRRLFPTAVTGSERDGWTFSFGEVPGTLTLAIRSFGPGWIVRIEGMTLAEKDFSSIHLGVIVPSCDTYYGKSLPMISDDDSGVIVFPCELELGSHCGKAGVYAVTDFKKDVTHLHFGIIAAPRAALIDALKAFQRVSKAPVSPVGGPWALGSEACRRSTFFTDMTEDSVDRWLDIAKRGHFGVVHFSRWYEALGTYPVNHWYFPHGLAGISNVCEKVRAAGFTPGIHTLTGCLSVNAPLVAERVGDLGTAFEYALARPFGPNDTELFITERPSPRHDLVLTYSSRGNVLRVGKELVQYAGIRSEPPYGFTGLKRGAFKTAKNVADVPAGSKVGYVYQRYMSFYPRPGTRLESEIADNIARVFKAGRMGDIYHDGAEGLGNRYAVDAVRQTIYDRLGSPAFVECSSSARPHGWWFQSRLGAWDHPRWAPKRFVDGHIRELEAVRKSDLLPPTTGWWEPRKAGKDSRGHFLDEMEYLAAKNAAYDCCTTIHSFDVRKGVSEYLRRQIDLFGTYEKFRLDRAFSDEALALMRPLGAESRLRKGRDGVWRLTSVTGETVRADGPASWKLRFSKRGKAALRVEALYAAETAPTNAVVLSRGADKVTFPFPYKSLEGNAAFALSVKGLGAQSRAILDVRLSSPREYSGCDSDHYIPLDFDGTRTVTFLLRERDAERRVREDPKCGLYRVLRDVVDLKHLSKIEFLVKGAPAVELGEFKAVPIVKTRQKHPTVTVNGVRHTVPFTLASGDWAELEDGVWSHWTEAGDLAGTAPGKMPEILAGENALSYEVESSEGGLGRAEVTVTAFGDSIPALRKAVSPVKIAKN